MTTPQYRLETMAQHSQPVSASAGISRPAECIIAVLLAVAALPLLLIWWPRSQLQRTRCQGLHGQPFDALRWQWQPGLRARLAARFGLGALPGLWNVVRGEMRLCGPRPLHIDETVPDTVRAWRQTMTPGLIGLWSLRQRTSIDYGDEWSSDLEQLERRSTKHELGLLLRRGLASLYAPSSRLAAEDRLLIDTLLVGSHTMDEALDLIQARLDAPLETPMKVCFINPDCVNIARRNAAYRATVNRAELVLADGIGMRIAANMLGSRFKQNVNGTDLFPRLCERLAKRGGSLYLLGAQPGVPEQVAQWLSKNHPNVRLAGYQHGYFDAAKTDEVVAEIRASQADVLLVAMGVPAQERWIDSHAEACGVRVAMGVGGLFDFVSGRIPRAPMWLRELGLEWTYRLYQEPARMWRRYLVGNVSFLIAIGMQRWIGSADPRSYLTEEILPFDQPLQRAVIIADWPDVPAWLCEEDRSTALLALGDRPIIHRVLETLAATGCTEADLYATQSVLTLRNHLGDGSRWGLRLRIHGVRDFDDASRRAVQLTQEVNDVWLVRADHWLPPEALRDAPTHCAWMAAQEEGSLHWSGWARLPGKDVRAALHALTSDSRLVGGLPSGIASIGARDPYRMNNADAILTSQARWLARTASPLERFTEPVAGVRIAPTARIAAGAELIAPVEIGDNAFVGRGVRIGPNVVVGDGAHLEGQVSIEHSLICNDVIITGEADLSQAVAMPAGLFDLRHDVWLPAQLTGDLIGDARGSAIAITPGLAERAAAVLIWTLAALPVMALSPVSRRVASIRPVWKGLPAVALGDATLVGTGRHETVPKSLHIAGWAKPLTEALPALIRPSQALGIADPEAAAWADVRWLVDHNWATRLALIKNWFKHTLSGPISHT